MVAKHSKKQISAPAVSSSAVSFLRAALVHITGWMSVLISICFFTATYDTAQVKLTLLHMGGIILLALWTALKITQRKSPFSRHNIIYLLPVFAYAVWNIICFIFAPYHMEAAEEFIRFLIYIVITLLAATEFSLKDIKIITRYLVATAWISFGYAVLQAVNLVLPGADPMPWSGFFAKRVFSTHANPNFFGDFVVFASCIVSGYYLLTRKKSLLILLGIGLISLFFTESKGAWLAYAAAAAVGAFLFTNYLSSLAKTKLRLINWVAVGLLIVTLGLAGFFTAKRFQSVSFRTFTWLSTFEMVQDNPVMGVGGPGSFKIIYSAYRRPQIFYIEDSHNTETQHAENEFLEQWAISGTVGLAIFLWLLIFLFTAAIKNLKQENNLAANKERNYLLLAYTAALAGMVIHSGVDISIRFASSGFFFALFMGILLALSFPPQPEENTTIFPAPRALLVVLRIVLLGLLAVAAVQLITSFHEITAALAVQTFGELILAVCAWTVCLGCVGGVVYLYLRSSWLLRSALAISVLCVSVPMVWLSYQPMRANHYYSVGIALNDLRNVEGAVGYFTRAVTFNPFQTEYRHFRANVFATLFNLTKIFSPLRGDTTGPSDDYTRALKDFAIVLERTPNHPMLHHNRGQLYYAMALRRSDDSTHAHSDSEYAWLRQEALDNMAQAKKAFERALLVDPVNPQTYAYLVQIALLENDLPRAQYWLDRFQQGPDGVTEPEFLQRNHQNPQMAALQKQVNERMARSKK